MKKLISLSLMLFMGLIFSSYLGNGAIASTVEGDLKVKSGADGISDINGSVIEISSEEQFYSLFDLDEDSSKNLSGSRGIVVYFTATWCGPCKQFTPKFTAAAKNLSGKVDFYKVDIDKFKDIASDAEIKSIPTLVLIPVEGALDTLEGVPAEMTSDQFAMLVESFFFGE